MLKLSPVAFGEIEGFAEDDHLAAFRVFASQARAIVEGKEDLRPALPASAELENVCRAVLTQSVETRAQARSFFENHFTPHRIGEGFATGYYEPIVPGSLVASAEFTAPILARPDDLVSFVPGTGLPSRPELSAARRLPDGRLVPFPDRAEIEASNDYRPLLWLADPIEVFLVQVQGSARVVLPDGKEVRLVYAGRNGWPYTSIGAHLLEWGEIADTEMGVAALKAWVRAHGQKPGDVGRALMHANRSYVFFDIDPSLAPEQGPVGGASLPLTPLRSLAVDRHIWPYGLPFWLSGHLPWQTREPTPFRRLMIAQDTGLAILGCARADIFFGSGGQAGELAGRIRHACDFTVLLPKTA